MSRPEAEHWVFGIMAVLFMAFALLGERCASQLDHRRPTAAPRAHEVPLPVPAAGPAERCDEPACD